MAFRMDDQIDLLCLHASASNQTRTTGLRLPDHRQLYLDYQGPISGDRGSVRRLNRGTVRWITHSPDRIELVVWFDSISCQIRGQPLTQPADSPREPVPALPWELTLVAL